MNSIVNIFEAHREATKARREELKRQVIAASIQESEAMINALRFAVTEREREAIRAYHSERLQV